VRNTLPRSGSEAALFYHVLADLVVAVHAAYVGYVVVGQLAILAGLAGRRQWVRNPWFRWTHLLMMSVVGFEAVCRIPCPLTVWEIALRRMAGEAAAEGTFVGRLLDRLIFLDAPPWVIESLHIGFALVVIGTFVLAPPRSFRKRPNTQQPAPAA
jgi:hypothetical protein